jgi:exosortase A
VAANEESIGQPVRREPRVWILQLGLLVSVLFWIVAWHWDTAASMAGIWWRSETFAHGIVVYPLSIWLIWRKRATLQQMSASPAYWALILLAGASFGWLLGDLGGVQAARHFSLVSMVALAVWVLLGTRMARVIFFPLVFTLLAAPIGEFLVPVLIEQTADFTVAALRLTGIPVYREGNNFVLPSGSWSVVEACSGLRYLIASVTLGLLYAYLTYTSLFKRSLFILASVLVPIVANWLRAYMIVMIGHLSGMKYAVGVDHLIYGWVFFGVVMLILFWIGSYWREDIDDKRSPGAVNSMAVPTLLVPGVAIAAVLVAALTAVAPSYSEYLASRESGSFATVVLPAPTNGWALVEPAAPLFRPHFVGGRVTVEKVFERNGRRVGLYIGYYSQEREGAELISFHNTLVPTRDRSWIQLRQGRAATHQPNFDAVQTQIRSFNTELTVWHWYWAGERWTTQPRIVKIRQAVDKLLGQGDDAAVVVAYTRSDKAGDDASALLHSFSQDFAPTIRAALTKARRDRRTAPAGQAARAP